VIDIEFAKWEAPWQPAARKNWQFTQIKHHYDIILGKMLQNSAQSSQDIEVPYLKSQHVQWDKVVIDDLPTMWASPREVEMLRVRKGDLLVCEGGEAGRAAFVINEPPVDCIIQNALHLVRPKLIGDVHFLQYLLQQAASHEWIDVICNRATIAHFTVEKFSQMWIWLPPLSEQQSIAQYLDRQTAKIDTLITAKQRLLELLTEKRRSLITHAVTRGLNPDAPLRDSGIGWLGMFPKHWETGRLKLICKSLQTGPFGSQLHAEDYVDGGIPVINPAHLINGRIEPDERVTVNKIMAEYLGVHKLEVGDVVLARRGDIGRCGLVTRKEIGWLCGTGSLRVRPDKEILDSKYLILLLTSTFAGSWLSLMSVGTTMDNLNTEIVGELAIPLPSLREQQAIVSYVENQTSKLDDLEAATKHTINLLQERRTALISAAVTGQVRIEESYATQESYP
jgi:type I restriction enzyme S subunit